MIKEYVDDLVSRITEEIEVEKQYHGEIIGKGGKQVQEVSWETINWSIIMKYFVLIGSFPTSFGLVNRVLWLVKCKRMVKVTIWRNQSRNYSNLLNL